MDITEEENLRMLSQYGISEWREKCLVITLEEKTLIEETLDREGSIPFLEMIRKPFPKFVVEYLAANFDNLKYLKDPAIGYKLYLLSEAMLTFFFYKIRNPKISIKDINNFINNHTKKYDLDIELNKPLDQLVSESVNKKNKHPVKFIYLTQYIDREEARRLGLKKASQFDADFERTGNDYGYCLEEKMSLLNPAARTILANYLGLYGLDPLSINEIASKYSIPFGRIKTSLDILLPSLLLTYGEFKNALGFIDKDYKDGEYRQYASRKAYKKTDINLTVSYIGANLSGLEGEALKTHESAEITAYIMAKYVFKDPNIAMEYILKDLHFIEAVIKNWTNKPKSEKL